MKSYHNTNNERGKQLAESEAKAQTQDESVLAIFKKGIGYTASEVWDEYGNWIAPLTSIRRAITNLMNAGIIEKTDEQRPGIYGKAEYVYKIARKPDPIDKHTGIDKNGQITIL